MNLHGPRSKVAKDSPMLGRPPLKTTSKVNDGNLEIRISWGWVSLSTVHFEDDFPYLSSEATMQPSPWLSLSYLVASSVRAATSLKVAVSRWWGSEKNIHEKDAKNSFIFNTKTDMFIFIHPRSLTYSMGEVRKWRFMSKERIIFQSITLFWGGSWLLNFRGVLFVEICAIKKVKKTWLFSWKGSWQLHLIFFLTSFAWSFVPAETQIIPGKKMWGCQEDNFNQMTLLLKNVGFSIVQKKQSQVNFHQLPDSLFQKRFSWWKITIAISWHKGVEGPPIHCSCWGSD